MTEDNFKTIMCQYEKLVFTVCYQMVQDYYEAQNLTQETFISAFLNIDKCESGFYRQWLCKIASNKAKDYLKSAYQRHTVLEKESEDENSIFDGITSLYGRPEEEYISQETILTVKNIIKNLKEPYLKVSVMFFAEEKSVREISEELNRPVKTVQTQLLRAKKIIKEKLQNMKGGAIK